jgi:adenine C2-methylase RlmN of 23S rRNA A2503 and tRNA A37
MEGIPIRYFELMNVCNVSFCAELAQGVCLALSLHAPTQDLREQIVPSARAYKLPKLMDAVLDFEQRSGQRVFVEYVMLAGVNDGEEVAHQLGALLKVFYAAIFHCHISVF